MSAEQAALAELTNDASDRSLQNDLRLLARDARAAAETEFAFQKARAAYAGSSAPRIALLLVAAAVFVFFALMALVVGLVIALAPLLTAWGSTAVVTLVLAVIALALLLAAKARWTATLAAIADERTAP